MFYRGRRKIDYSLTMGSTRGTRNVKVNIILRY